MSLPPPPDSYGGQPPDGGHPQWAGQAPGAGEGQFSGPPLWGPPPQQPQWGGPPPGPPPSKGGKGKWVLGGVIVLLVVALAVTVTILVTGDGSNQNSPKSPGDGPASEYASANDTGPVNIITEDPTCEPWLRIASDYADQTKSVNWSERDKTIATTSWTPEQRAMYQAVGDALTKAADQTTALIARTPHRSMRELYQQFVAYGRSFVSEIPTYVEADGSLAGAADGLTSTIAAICSAIEYKVAQPLAPLIIEVQPPSGIAPLDDPDNPTVFLPDRIAICDQWNDNLKKSDADTAAWRALDPSVPAKEWNSEQRSINESVGPIMTAVADQYESLARNSGNPVFEDFGVLAAQYQRAFVEALPTYMPADNYLSNVATFLASSVNSSCRAAS